MRKLLPLALAATALCLVPASSAMGDSTSSSTSTTTTLHKVKKPVHLAPLTGLPDRLGVTKRRPALTVKIDNTPEAHPQSGIQDADVIYEEIVEGGITRLAAIFNSKLPPSVGPVRSVRRTDREIVDPLGGIFVCSGGAQYALQSIATAPVHFIDQSSAGAAMYRSSTRYAPHNLYAVPTRLMTVGGKPRPPHPLFHYTSDTRSTLGRPIASFTVGFGAGFATSYQWNGRTKSWDRSIFSRPDVTATGQRVSPTNVIVMTVHYKNGMGVEGSEAELTGSGPVDVFTNGRLQSGTWRRSTMHRATVYVSTSGHVITLQPGQTWIELMDVSEHVNFVASK
ncbi:MAG TPA: DUF3048 domain-containing protein [Acidimicrobiales bacterium]|nr:DUF3048 domain-containing protein [Acidimicrobiales bacterium]